MSENIINPMDRPCCANCSNLMINSVADEQLNRHTFFSVSPLCPHKNERPFKMFYSNNNSTLKMEIEDMYINEVSSLFDFVCTSWEGHGEPINLDER